ncbi:hypothetical protein V6Z12_A09G104300 [Gossypium hirsutum]
MQLRLLMFGLPPHSLLHFDGFEVGLHYELFVISMEGFEHLGFLIQFEDKGSDGVFLSRAASIFANSDPDLQYESSTVKEFM